MSEKPLLPQPEDEQGHVLTFGSERFDMRIDGERERAVEYMFKHVFMFPRILPSILSIYIVSGCGAIGAVLVGLAISYVSREWAWFSRSGALCLIVGAVLVFFDVTDYYDRKTAALSRFPSFLAALLEKMATDDRMPDEVRSKVLSDKDAVEMQKRDIAQSADLLLEKLTLKRRMKILEFALLALGTLVWAFGDLLGTVIGPNPQ